MLLLLQICFCFVVREISYCLFFTADVNEAFNFTSTCLDDLLNTGSSYYEKMERQRYPTEFKSDIS